jgi:hypothetical protein
MKLKHLILTLGAASLLATTAQAAPVTLTDSYKFSTANTFFAPTGAFTGTPYYFEIINNLGSNQNATVTLVDSNPDARRINYAVFTDTNLAEGASNTGTSVTLTPGGSLKDDATSNAVPFFTFLMQAGAQYVLQLTGDGTGITGSVSTISAVPLPGAIWLFGSALLGFLGFSNRRKI